MSELAAVLVGVEKYTQPGWNIEGPSENVVKIANLLLEKQTDPKSMLIVVDPLDGFCSSVLDLEQKGVCVLKDTRYDNIQRVFQEKLEEFCPTATELLVYWNGHGCVSSGNRLCYCSDFTLSRNELVFNYSLKSAQLSRPPHHRFKKQILLADICSTYDRTVARQDDLPNEPALAVQELFYASREGEYAQASGLSFTGLIIEQLAEVDGRLDPEKFAERLERRCLEHELRSFRFSRKNHAAESEYNVVATSLAHRVASYTSEYLRGLDESLDVGSLVWGECDPTMRPPRGSLFHLDSQQVIFDQLLSRVERVARGQNQTFLITGSAGVGKSTVLRRIGRQLADTFIGEANGRGRLPIVLSLQSLNLNQDELSRLKESAEPMAEKLGKVLLKQYCRFFQFEENELLALLGSTSCVYILDSVDEFLSNHHPHFGIEDFRSLAGWLEGSSAVQSGVVVVGVRNSQPGFASLAKTVDRFEISPMSIEQAEHLFPETGVVVRGIPQSAMRQLLMTPLILSFVRPHASRIAFDSVHSIGYIVIECLRAMLEASELDEMANQRGVSLSSEDWVNALMFLGWRYFMDGRTQYNLTELRNELLKNRAEWIAFFEGHERRSDEVIVEAKNQCDRAFRILCEEGLFESAIRVRTILQSDPTRDENLLRFSHVQWRDVLAARCLSFIIKVECFEELLRQRYATTGQMMTLAGQFLSDFELTARIIGDVLKQAHQPGGAGATSTLLATMAQSQGPINGPAFSLVFGGLRQMPRLPKLFAISTFGMRALRDDPGVSAIIRREIRPMLERILDPDAPDDSDGILRSLAWCHLRLFEVNFDSEPPCGSWPGFVAQNEEIHTVKAIFHDPSGFPAITSREKSLQYAMSKVLSTVLTDEARPISVVHYLYYLTLAHVHGAAIAEVSADLHEVFAEASPIAYVLRTYEPLTQVRDLFERCRELFHGQEPPV